MGFQGVSSTAALCGNKWREKDFPGREARVPRSAWRMRVGGPAGSGMASALGGRRLARERLMPRVPTCCRDQVSWRGRPLPRRRCPGEVSCGVSLPGTPWVWSGACRVSPASGSGQKGPAPLSSGRNRRPSVLPDERGPTGSLGQDPLPGTGPLSLPRTSPR